MGSSYSFFIKGNSMTCPFFWVKVKYEPVFLEGGRVHWLEFSSFSMF